ncbi:VCBS repeat-containing protein [Streptomyces sp. NPDC002896]|uniref:FG-GAP repeat domain-containing protein n=1 Tax=Streptomyces sp. NPDC002896 TaxID=3154438 RepID=UPI003325E2AE
MKRHSLPAVLTGVCATALLAAGCSGDDGTGSAQQPKPASAPSSSEPANRDTGEVNRDDVNGDGRSDVVVNGWYKYPKTGGEWFNNRFIAFASPSGLDPTRAFRLSEDFAKPDPRIDSSAIFQDRSVQFTGDLDDDGHADIVVRNQLSHRSGKYTRYQRIVWGGPKGATGVTELPSETDDAIATGDFDGTERSTCSPWASRVRTTTRGPSPPPSCTARSAVTGALLVPPPASTSAMTAGCPWPTRSSATSTVTAVTTW